MAESWEKVVLQTIEGNKDRLNNLSSEIWSNPELPHKEFRAHDLLTSFLSEEGFQVERNFVLPTGFKATFESAPANKDEDGAGDSQSDKPLNACFLCEYDAIVGVGHGAGHNLCSEASIAAALAVKACIQQKLFSGKVKSCSLDPWPLPPTPVYLLQTDQMLNTPTANNASKENKTIKNKKYQNKYYKKKRYI